MLFEDNFVHDVGSYLVFREKKGFLGWKIADEDKATYQQKKDELLRAYNKLLEKLKKYNIPYKTQHSINHGEPYNRINTQERRVTDFWGVTIVISKEKKQWFFELTRELGCESLVTEQKKLAGSWYDKIKATQPAQEMIENIGPVIDDHVNYAYENRMESIRMDCVIESYGIKLYYYRVNPGDFGDNGLAFSVYFQDLGYEDMNEEQVAALKAIYLETARSYCCKQDMIFNEDFGYNYIQHNDVIRCIIYLKETKKLKSW